MREQAVGNWDSLDDRVAARIEFLYEKNPVIAAMINELVKGHVQDPAGGRT